jgi:hypothetical protein
VWTDPASAFCAGLGTAIGLPVIFKGFAWSGRKLGSSRLIAANGLAQEIAAIIEMQPDAKGFVIGHGHGGDVALKAVQMAKLEEQVGVVCISTPFFDITRRNIGGGKELKTLSQCVLAAATLAMAFILVRKVGRFSSRPFSALLGSAITPVAALWPFSKLSQAAARLVEDLSVPVSPKLDLMIVGTAGNEPAIVIATFQSIRVLSQLSNAQISRHRYEDGQGEPISQAGHRGEENVRPSHACLRDHLSFDRHSFASLQT